MRPYATSVCGLTLLVYAALSYQCTRPLKLLVQVVQAVYSMLLRFEVSRSGLQRDGALVLSSLALPVQKCKY
jgi:hypothetical protein